MISLENNMSLKDDAALRLASPAGDYDDTALVECYDPENPAIGFAMYQAQYVKYGNLVYQYNDPKELGAAILAIEPASTHTAAAYVRMTNELLAQMNSGSLEGSTLESAITENEEVIPEETVTPVEETQTPTDTEIVPDTGALPEEIPDTPLLPDPESIPSTSEATTTPEVLGTATSTEAMPPLPVEPVTDESASTTPELISLMTKKITRRRRV